MRYTDRFTTVQLQTYTDEQIAFIASVEHDYDEQDGLSAIVADYADELTERA